jgi:hypothetical protein
MSDPFAELPATTRDDIRAILPVALRKLGEPGAWLTAAQRVAVAAEVRQAWKCPLCKERKEALSPYTVAGEHKHLGTLPAAWVDIVHPVTTDSGRLTRAWYQGIRAAGVGEDEFVEIVSVAIIAVVIDSFMLGAGAALPALPEPKAGEPARQRVEEATLGPGWVSTIAPENVPDYFADFYAHESYFYIRRSLTLVPEEVRRFWELMNPLYMADPRVPELEGLDRAISRAQIEFLAARASALLGCYY